MPRQAMTDVEMSEFLERGTMPSWAIEQARERAELQRVCTHDGWNWKQHGRCCFTCGAFVVDFGD